MKSIKAITNIVVSLGLYPMDSGKTLIGCPVHGKTLYNGHLLSFSIHHPPLSIHIIQTQTYQLFFSNLAYEITLHMELVLN